MPQPDREVLKGLVTKMARIFEPTWSAIWKYLVDLPDDLKAEVNIVFDFYVPSIGGDRVFEDEHFKELPAVFEEISQIEKENFLTLFSFLNIIQIDEYENP